MGRMLTAPGGRPVSATISATVSIVSGSLDGGLRTIEQPAAMAGASLCAARLSGKLKGLMAATGPMGKRRVMPEATARGGHQVERDRLAGHPLGLLGAQAEGQHRAIDLDQRVADRLAGLEGDRPTELLASGLDARADLAQHAATLVGRQPAGLLERGHGGVDRRVVLLGGGVVGPAGRRVGMGRVTDLQDVG